MTLDETRPLCIISHVKHADVLIRMIIVCLYSLVPQLSVLAFCFTQMFLPFLLLPNEF